MRHDQEFEFNAVAKVAKTFGDSRAFPKLLASFATFEVCFDRSRGLTRPS
ncbi:hypothetical protein RSSM_05616 [Rhodopirellula sallentina SM41]|uniref:Uncharacterized protein n=1 Tax=Rhodopirellula sallentina SM41 TaxID=1263870 RepID=M5TUS7_9BACT|nr:hypothetical protein RSSM_05616 [Rhodopirellula sallentina SM41]